MANNVMDLLNAVLVRNMPSPSMKNNYVHKGKQMMNIHFVFKS